MKEDKKNIDILFEEKLRQFRESPPAYTWNRLEKDLNREKSVKRFFYFRLAAASLLILIAFGAGYFYATYESVSSQKISQELVVPNNELNDIQSEIPVEIEIDTKSIKTETGSPVQQETKSNFTLSDQSKKQRDNDLPLLESNNEKRESNVLIAEKNVKDIKVLDDNSQKPETIAEENQITENSDAEVTIALKKDEPVVNEIISDYLPLVLDPNAKAYGMEQTNKRDVKWSVGAQIAPVWSYRDISINYANQSGNNVQEAESQLNDTEDALISYAGGIDVNYFLSDRWNIQSGMYYSKIGQVNNNALNFRQDNGQYILFAISTSTGNVDVAFGKIPDNIKKINPQKDTLNGVDLNNVKLIQNFDLFEIPVMIKYKIIDKKLGINISGGLSPAYLISNNIILQVDNDKYDIGNSANLNNMIFNTTISLGLNYALSKKLSLNLEPNFKYSLSPINKNSNFDYHPYYFSWFTGLSYKF